MSTAQRMRVVRSLANTVAQQQLRDGLLLEFKVHAPKKA